MSADNIVYCLEHLTDYWQFERLCSDVMNQSGFRDIEPLGGTNDKGRDALHVSRANPDDITIFAYSVRADWQQKLLNEDCERIREEGHKLHRLVFVCTSSITATQRDTAIERVHKSFGWALDLFDIERLRVRLVGDLRHLIAQHPSIFCPPFFPSKGGISIAECRDTIVIDHHPADHSLATWLARRLQLAGYRTWCYGTAPLAGESADESVRVLIEKRAIRYFPILSETSVADVDFVGRIALASNSEDFVVPCSSRAYNNHALPRTIRDVTPAAFDESWATGLNQILKSLSGAGIKPALSEEQGKGIALRAYVPEPTTKPVPEKVYANVFAVETPDSILICEIESDLNSEQESKARKEWAFAIASPTVLLAFDNPPNGVPLKRVDRLPEYSWRDFEYHKGKRSKDIVKELVRRSLDVACVQAGMEWCDDRNVFYFPHDGKPQRNVAFTHVDGRKTRVCVAGMKTYGNGVNAKPFRYQLCPLFSVGFDEQDECWATMRIYVRITTLEGEPFEKKGITRRRKKVGNNWWNKEWFARTIALMQALSGHEGSISIGSKHRGVFVRREPLDWECPVSIDYEAVERIGDFQEEMAQLRYIDFEDEMLEEESKENG